MRTVPGLLVLLKFINTGPYKGKAKHMLIDLKALQLLEFQCIRRIISCYEGAGYEYERYTEKDCKQHIMYGAGFGDDSAVSIFF